MTNPISRGEVEQLASNCRSMRDVLKEIKPLDDARLKAIVKANDLSLEYIERILKSLNANGVLK